MLRYGLLPALAITALALACVRPVAPEAEENPVPFITGLSPEALDVSAGDPMLEVVGEGFAPDGWVTWNGGQRQAEFESPSRLRVTLEAGDVAGAGANEVRVVNPTPGGGTSTPRSMEVHNLRPRLDSIRPESVTPAPGGTVTVTLYGHGFVEVGGGSTVLFDDARVPAQFVSPSELHATLGEQLLREGRAWDVTVSNPAPGGGGSEPVSFGSANPPPTVTAVAPDTIFATRPATLHVSGSGFVPGAVVLVDTVRYEPLWLSQDSLVVHIPSVGPSRVGDVRVENPHPGGGLSAAIAVVVGELRPYVSRTDPPALEQGSAARPWRVVGRNFAPDAVVTLNGVPYPATQLDAGTLDIMVPTEDMVSVTPLEVVVTNPRGGGASDPLASGVVPPGRIAYAHGRDRSELTSASVNGDGRVSIPTQGSLRIEELDTWANGDTIVYTGRSGFTALGLVRSAPDGEAVVLADPPVAGLSVAPDGAWIYFSRQGTLHRVRPDGSEEETVLAPSAEGEAFHHPDASPAGDRLVYIDAESELHVLDLTDGSSVALGVLGDDPRWSPDGAWLAYAATGRRLAVVRPDGTQERVFDDVPTFGASSFDWSPDGAFLLSLSWADEGGPEGAPYTVLELVELEGGSMIQFGVPGYDRYTYASDWKISWYPDPDGS